MATHHPYEIVFEELSLQLIRRKGDPQIIMEHFESDVKEIQMEEIAWKNYGTL